MSLYSPVYCFVLGGNVHCVPGNTVAGDSLLQTPEDPGNGSEGGSPGPKSIHMRIRNRNLLYTFNNPSLLDLESDTNSRLQPPEEANGRLTPPPSTEETKLLAILNNYSTHAVYLPKYTISLPENLKDGSYSEIKDLLLRVFPKWVDSSRIAVKQLTGGITNMLLSCTYTDLDETVLMRVYGHGTNLIIDRHREFISHLVLNSLLLAPAIHARFANGLVYGFLPGRSLDAPELRTEGLYPLIAQQLGNWHNSIHSEYIEDGVEKLRMFSANLKKQQQLQLSPTYKKPKKDKKKRKPISNVWDVIEDWIEIVPPTPALVDAFQENTSAHVTEENLRDIIKAEFAWLKSTLSNVTKSPVVSSHCDLLSGNIIIPSSDDFARDHLTSGDANLVLPPLLENPIQFIDYEYMLPAPRAFDIANHLAEWQGLSCDKNAIPVPSPKNPTMVKWCKGYLNDVNASEDEINDLIREIACYYGLPGFYWGIWAIIQSEISNIDFNYSDYGKLRLQEYWYWKSKFLKNNLSYQQ